MRLITELYPHQWEAAEKLEGVKVGALYMEMGTGKTRTALELLSRRLEAGKVRQALWLCPYSIVPDMPELLQEHAEGAMEVIRLGGIESLSGSLRIYRELMAYVDAAPTYLIVDESLLVKNPAAYRTQRVTDISRRCQYKLILNGTPISRNEADLFAQWYVLDWRILGYRSYWSFAANHLEFDPDRPGKVVRALNTDYLARKIGPYTYECRKDDVLALPPKTSRPRYFRMTKEQDEHYGDIADRLLALVDERRPETIYRLFSALQAITSGFAIRLEGLHSSRYRMYPPRANPRIEALLEALREVGDEQAVIYCRFTQEIEDIVEVLEGRGVPYNGEMSQAQRHANKEAFQAGRAQFLVANKSCAQFGLNLQFCRWEIFYNNDWDYGTRRQAEDRVHRIGQTQEVFIRDICAAGSLDETILDCLSRKYSLTERFRDAIAKNAMESLIRGKEV